MMKQVDRCQIAVVGGGHAGLLATIVLAAAGFNVRVIDPMGPGRPPASGRTLAILAGSHAALRQLGAWRYLAAVAWPVRRVDVRDTASGGHVVYRSSEVGHEPLAYGVDNSVLRGALSAAVERDCWVRGSLVSMERRGVLVVDDGRRLRADLVIGADGRGSVVRRLAGISIDSLSYRQSAISFIVAHERDGRHVVMERLRPQGPLATLPLGRHSSGITWVEADTRAEAVYRRLRSGDMSLVEAELGSELGSMHIDGPVQFYPLSAQHARRYVAPGIALIGDAAHGVHPIHAQGFNMGVADIVALLDVLDDARRRSLPIGGEAILRYQRARQSDNASRLRMTDALNRLFSNDIAPLRQGRRLLLDTLAAAGPVRRRAIRHGMRMSA
ncbi:MAG: FAD-dependent monooxygenase [Geminicoccaceae bacterium]|nr:FAD-dependent monooxygenase [Geminicoccaceae bacterium]